MNMYEKKLLNMIPKSELIDIMINHDNCHLRLQDVLRQFGSRHKDALWEKYLALQKRKGLLAAEPAFTEWRDFNALICQSQGRQLPAGFGETSFGNLRVGATGGSCQSHGRKND